MGKTGLSRSSVNDRLNRLISTGEVRRPSQGSYQVTPEGIEAILEEEPEVDLADILSYRVVAGDDAVIGRRDRVVIQYASGDVVAYETDLGEEERLELDPIWVRSPDVVRDRVEGVLEDLLDRVD